MKCETCYLCESDLGVWIDSASSIRYQLVEFACRHVIEG